MYYLGNREPSVGRHSTQAPYHHAHGARIGESTDGKSSNGGAAGLRVGKAAFMDDQIIILE